VGATGIRAAIADPVATRTGKKAGKSSPLVRIVAAIGIPFAVWQLASEPPADLPSSPKKAPALFPASAATACPQAQGDQAIAYGREQQQLADAKRKRHPFHAYDGVQAVGLYRVAAACMRAGGDPGSAADLTSDADQLQAEIEGDYRTHRARLEHALSVHDRAVVRQEVAALRDLTTGQSGEYVTWLSSLQRRLQLQANAGAAK
jgi:hypothetical protein